MRVAIIGIGHVATYQIDALLSSNEWVLSALCDLDLNKKAQFSGTPFYTSIENLLEQEFIDAIVISTPHSAHYKLVMQALEAGKHVLLEKPATANADELRELFAFAREQDLSLVVALHAAFGREVEWFSEHYRQYMEAVNNPITSFTCHFSDPYVHEGQLIRRGRSLGGSWIDSSINALSILDQLLDRDSLRITTFSASYLPDWPQGDTNAIAEMDFGLPTSTGFGSGSIYTNWELGKNLKQTELRFADESTQVLLHHSNQQVIACYEGKAPQLLADFSASGERLTNHYQGVFRDFRQHVNAGTDNGERAQSIIELALLPLQSQQRTMA